METLLNLVITVINLIILALNLKIYTEILKDRKIDSRII